jgi:catechol 2,3-dioxygenase-like lactoylglutathione lyase family enzyme
MKSRLLFVLTALAIATPSFAQLASPNATGAALGHIHINATDVDAHVRFWTSVGGQIVQREKLTMVQIPGVYILLRKQDSTGGTNGSVLNHFGATAGKRLTFETATVPGTEIALGKADAALVPTKGRSVDHIGFEVKSIDAFVAKLQAAGIKTEAAIRNSTNASDLRIAFITDPWGTEIALTEGLATTPRR